MKREELLKLWGKWADLISQDQIDTIIDQENDLIGKIEKALPFKDEEEHQKWLNCLFTFKYWEDFEGMTLNIINRLK